MCTPLALAIASILAASACSSSTSRARRGVIADVEGCELGRIGRGWASVDGSDRTYIISRRMRYATVRVHRAESAEALAADVMAGRSPRYADDQVLPETRAVRIEIGGTEYPAWWVGTPNVIAYVFVPSNVDGYVFLVWLDLEPTLEEEEKDEDWKMQRVDRLLRPLVRSLRKAPVESFRKCVSDV